MITQYRRSESGFTIVEVLVTLAIMVILGTVITSGLVFVNRYNKERLVATHRENELSRIADHLERVLETSKIQYPDSAQGAIDSLVIITRIADTTKYEVADGVLYKNSDVVNSPSIAVDSISFAEDDKSQDASDRAIYMTLHASSGEKKYEVKRMARITKQS